MEIKLQTPLTVDKIKQLKAGDMILLSGEIYTGRDAAHKRMDELLQENKPLPFDVTNQAIYYVGPTPAKPNQAVGSAGPTSSYRMDAYTPTLLSLGLKAMIGKGKRSKEVIEAMKKYQAVYFGVVGGAAALVSKAIIKSELIAFEDLGAEAICKYTIQDMPMVVLIDCEGNNLYETQRKKYEE